MGEVYQGDGELIPSRRARPASAIRSLSGGRRTDSQLAASGSPRRAEVYQGDGELIPSDSHVWGVSEGSLSGGRRTDSQLEAINKKASTKSIRGTENSDQPAF